MTKRQQTLVLLISLISSMAGTSWGQSAVKRSLHVSATVLPTSSFTLSPIPEEQQQTQSSPGNGATLSVKCTSGTRLTIQLDAQRPLDTLCSGFEQSLALSINAPQLSAPASTVTITY